MAKKPTSLSNRELPLLPMSYWDTVTMVKHALDDLERGYFRLAAHLVDAMLRDDRITGVLAARVNGLLGQPLEIDPGEDATAQQQKIADGVKKTWPRMFPESDLEDFLKWGVMLGLGLGELLWQTKDVWTPKLKVWHPSMLYWDWGPREYRLITMDGVVELPESTSGSWAMFTPYGYQRGWMRGAVRALALPWLIRNWARRDWSRQSEVNGNAIKVGVVPMNAPDKERKRFVNALMQLGGEGVLEAPELPNGAGKFDLKLVEANADTWEGFSKLLEHADTAIAIVLLGQNLTTEVKQGSRSAAQVHDQVRKDFQQADATKLGRCLQDQVLRPYAEYNFGDPELAPFPAWQTEPPEDQTARADALQKIGGFLTSAKQSGAPIDQRALLEDLGVALLTPEQEAQNKVEDAERAAAAQAALAAAAKPDEEEPEDAPAPPPAKAKKKKLAEPTEDEPALPAGSKRGQAYVDKLAARGAVQGEQLLHVDLADVLREVHDATSAKDLRKRLTKLVGKQNPDALAQLLEKVHVLGELAGRSAVLEDL